MDLWKPVGMKQFETMDIYCLSLKVQKKKEPLHLLQRFFFFELLKT